MAIKKIPKEVLEQWEREDTLSMDDVEEICNNVEEEVDKK